MLKVEWDAALGRIAVSGPSDDDESVELLAAKLNDLIQDRRISGIRDMSDESTVDGALLAIQLKRGADAEPVLDVIHGHVSGGEGDSSS